MRKGNYSLGGEQSGHLIFLNYSTTGDGVLAALKLLSVMVGKQKPLSELAALMTDFPQVLKNIVVKEKKDIKKIPAIQDVITDAEKQLGDRGRILVRFSGTELKARVMVEGEDEALINRLADDVAGIIEKELG
jgi:phosphoglucosamine mutase